MARKRTLPDDAFKAFAYEQFARIGKALASPARLVLLNVLVQGPHTVEELADQAGLPVANASHHLQVLKASGLVLAERRGQHVLYAVAGEGVGPFFQALKSLAREQLVELQRALEDISASPTRSQAVDRDELMQRAKSGESVVIDVRPASEFASGHLPGAVSVPLDQLEKRLADLPRDREVVAYCRGRYCLLADRAVERLEAAGYRARRSDVEVVGWRLADLPLEGGPGPA
jgi:rhodanese-related sulfurtransferase/DNA-binding transcriptional ArsR family regulator